MKAVKQQYLTIKAKYMDALVLFRIGDFYESFGEDAKTIADQLGIKLSEVDDPDLKFNTGFPHYSLENYLHKLVKKGNRVAICEQLKVPKKAKQTVKRGVTDFLK